MKYLFLLVAFLPNAALAMTCGISVNGKCYSLPKKGSFEVNSKGVFVDGKPYTEFSKEKEKTINVVIDGDVNVVKDVDSVTIKGAAGNASTTNGNIAISGDVGGDVTSVNGEIKVSTVKGKVSTVNGNIDQRLLP